MLVSKSQGARIKYFMDYCRSAFCIVTLMLVAKVYAPIIFSKFVRNHQFPVFRTPEAVMCNCN